jgi:hypothetical protein
MTDIGPIGSHAIAVAAVAFACTACTPTMAPPPDDSPLIIDFVWTLPSSRTIPLDNGGRRIPKEVVIRWDAAQYSTVDIQAIADRQCVTFDRAARPEAEPTASGERRAQHFECVEPPAKRSSTPHRG